MVEQVGVLCGPTPVVEIHSRSTVGSRTAQPLGLLPPQDLVLNRKLDIASYACQVGVFISPEWPAGIKLTRSEPCA
jgi:hypothetical protein